MSSSRIELGNPGMLKCYGILSNEGWEYLDSWVANWSIEGTLPTSYMYL